MKILIAMEVGDRLSTAELLAEQVRSEFGVDGDLEVEIVAQLSEPGEQPPMYETAKE